MEFVKTINQLLNRRGIGYIQLHKTDRLALWNIRIQPGSDHLRPFRRQRLSNRQPDPTRPTGDESSLIGKTMKHSRSLVRKHP